MQVTFNPSGVVALKTDIVLLLDLHAQVKKLPGEGHMSIKPTNIAGLCASELIWGGLMQLMWTWWVHISCTFIYFFENHGHRVLKEKKDHSDCCRDQSSKPGIWRHVSAPERWKITYEVLRFHPSGVFFRSVPAYSSKMQQRVTFCRR